MLDQLVSKPGRARSIPTNCRTDKILYVDAKDGAERLCAKNVRHGQEKHGEHYGTWYEIVIIMLSRAN